MTHDWVRNYSYIGDYYNTLYEIYTKDYVGYPVTYYSVDFDKSIYDRDELEGGSYDKFGVGDLSGFKWKKIILLPVYGIEQIQPMFTGDEKGLTLSDSENTSCSFSESYGLLPNEWDVINFYQDFMFDYDVPTEPIFVVKNTSMATYGKITHWKCDLKVAPFTLSDLENQVSEVLMFLEVTKKIYTIETAQEILKSLNMLQTIGRNYIPNIYDDKVCMYLLNENEMVLSEGNSNV